jgi:hypothetical protein
VVVAIDGRAKSRSALTAPSARHFQRAGIGAAGRYNRPMNDAARRIQRTLPDALLGNTLPLSSGINTLFLLDAGSNQAFAATFHCRDDGLEILTGIVADTWAGGLLPARPLTLAGSTLSTTSSGSSGRLSGCGQSSRCCSGLLHPLLRRGRGLAFVAPIAKATRAA